MIIVRCCHHSHISRSAAAVSRPDPVAIVTAGYLLSNPNSNRGFRNRVDK